MRGTAFQHVLVECEAPNVFLVLVLDMPGSSVVGHHLLDLNAFMASTESNPKVTDSTTRCTCQPVSTLTETPTPRRVTQPLADRRPGGLWITVCTTH